METPTSNRSFFLACRILTLIVGFYHANKFFFPQGSNAIRHLVFVGINAIIVFGLWKRPQWFTYFFGALLVQQWYSHGGYALQQWRAIHSIDWKSVAVILLMPIIFIALLKDRKHASEAP